MAYCLMMAAAPAALAHAVLESSTPSAGSLLPAGAVIDLVELGFDEPVNAAPGSVQVIAADGSRVDTGVVDHPGDDGAKVAVGVRDGISEGSYLVVWRVVSADSHPVHGSFTFSLGRAGSVADAAADPTAGGVGVALGINRFVGYAAILLLVGVASFFLLCWPSKWPDATRGRLIRGSLIAAAGADIVGIGLQSAYDAGGGWASAIDMEGWSAILATRFGIAHLFRLMLLGIVWVATSRLQPNRRTTRVLVAAGLTAVLLSVAMEGHSGGTPLLVALDVAHLAAAGAWFGGLTVLTLEWLGTRQRLRITDRAVASPTSSGAVAVMERSAARSAHPLIALRRFSALAMGSVIVLAISGVLQAVRQVAEWGALTDTTYGRILMIKIGGVVLVLAAAAVSRAVLYRRAAVSDEARLTRLGRSVACETVMLVVVLAVTAALVATPPARVDYRPVQDVMVNAGPVSVQVSAVPLAPMTVSLHLYTFGANGLPTDVLNVQAEATHSEGSPQSITVPLVPGGTGHFIAEQVLLPQVGSWTLRLTVRASTVDVYSTTASLTVR